MAAYATDTSFLSRRAIVFFSIVTFHVLIVWALASGLARQVVEIIAPPIETDIIEELEQREEPPPPPPPEMERPPVEVPPPEVAIDIPMESTTAIQDVTDRPPPPRPPPPRRSCSGVLLRSIQPKSPSMWSCIAMPKHRQPLSALLPLLISPPQASELPVARSA